MLLKCCHSKIVMKKNIPLKKLIIVGFLVVLFLGVIDGVSGYEVTISRTDSCYPNYVPGCHVELIIQISPADEGIPIYMWREKDGIQEYNGKEYAVKTNSDGRIVHICDFSGSETCPSVEIYQCTVRGDDVYEYSGSGRDLSGVYTDEYVRVGSPTGPKSNVLSFTVLCEQPLQTCAELGGTCCSSGQICKNIYICPAHFEDSSDCGWRCCVHGECAWPTQTCAELGGTCKNNSCDNYNDCNSLAGTCASGYCCSGTCTEKSEECKLTSALWSVAEAVEGDSVSLNVAGTNCDQETISFEIRENDGTGWSSAQVVNTNPANVVFSGGATGIWTAEYQEDISGDPEYFFRAIVVSTGEYIQSSDPDLSVTKLDLGYCGNGILEEGEECDDGNNLDGDGCSAVCEIEEAVKCYLNTDCGADYCAGANYCIGNDVYQDFIVYTCNNPGTVNSYCSKELTPILIKECEFGCDDGECIKEPTDTEAPEIELIKPKDNLKTENTEIEFVYEVNDDSNIKSCSLIINNYTEETDISIEKNIEQSFTVELEKDEDYMWKIICVDEFDNIGESETRSLKIAEDDKKKKTHKIMKLFFDCEPLWECSDWSECYEGMKTRTCYDKNYCNNDFTKPIERTGCEIISQVLVEESKINWLLILLSILVLFILIFILILLLIRKNS